MIKLISVDNPDILAFRVSEEMQQEDVDWMVQRIIKKQERANQNVLLYVEFEDFGELTLKRMWTHFKMLLDHVFKLMDKVNKIAAVTSNTSLREKLSIEFALVPTLSFKAFQDDEKTEAYQWLSNV